MAGKPVGFAMADVGAAVMVADVDLGEDAPPTAMTVEPPTLTPRRGDDDPPTLMPRSAGSAAGAVIATPQKIATRAKDFIFK